MHRERTAESPRTHDWISKSSRKIAMFVRVAAEVVMLCLDKRIEPRPTTDTTHHYDAINSPQNTNSEIIWAAKSHARDVLIR